MDTFDFRIPGLPKISLCLASVLGLYALALPQNDSYLPNPKLTPGDALDVTKDDLCNSGHERLDRKVPVAVKRQVFDSYGISPTMMGYNVDHLIPEKLGGSNSIRNLWPQPLSGKWNHSRKNRLEQRLYEMVCKGAIDLKQAQREIAADWVKAYRKHIGDSE
ncbi:MAG: HNH endonuclease [Blastocatellia bacterium]|nr:HNH endonuclease [Blastocatellia bacterium]